MDIINVRLVLAKDERRRSCLLQALEKIYDPRLLLDVLDLQVNWILGFRLRYTLAGGCCTFRATTASS